MRIASILLLVLFIKCTTIDQVKNADKILNFKSFDIFTLKGRDTLKRGNNKEYVKVAYDTNSFPIYIKYYMPQRTVTLVLEDSFKLISGKPVYCYTTSNFMGGHPGKQRVYASLHEEYKDILYVSLSDTLICQTENVPQDLNIFFDLYVRKRKNLIYRTSTGESDYDGKNREMTRINLYSKWFDSLTQKFSRESSDPIIGNRLPPY